MMNSVFEEAQRMTEMWMDFWSRIAGAGWSLQSDATPSDAAQKIRQAVFQSMSQAAEQYMRSPQFLELTRQSMEAATNFRQRVNDALTAMHHNLQGLARQDIDSIMLSMRHLEQRVLDSLEDIQSRLSDIERRLGSMSNGKATGRPSRLPGARAARRQSSPAPSPEA